MHVVRPACRCGRACSCVLCTLCAVRFGIRPPVAAGFMGPCARPRVGSHRGVYGHAMSAHTAGKPAQAAGRPSRLQRGFSLSLADDGPVPGVSHSRASNRVGRIPVVFEYRPLRLDYKETPGSIRQTFALGMTEAAVDLVGHLLLMVNGRFRSYADTRCSTKPSGSFRGAASTIGGTRLFSAV